ncbi:MAG: ERCC4 domain-containing protein [bacterium]|nr:ERCC4 domain-containing protein [bacterium]
MPAIRIESDFRERSSGVPAVLARRPDIVVVERALRVGDYLVNDSITVERKTCRDLCLSIVDGRLFSQVSRMRNQAKRPLLLIEGTDLHRSGVSIAPGAVRGALASVSVCWYMPVVFTGNPAETAEFLETAGRQDLLFEQELWLRPGRKPRSGRRRRLYILQGLPEVGPHKALALLDHFGSIDKVVRASENELLTIPSIGRKTAAAIRGIVT